MQAYQLYKWRTHPRLVDIPQPEPGANEVLVKVGGNGLCHSDLHAVDDMAGSPPHLNIELPMVLGRPDRAPYVNSVHLLPSVSLRVGNQQ